MSMLLMVKAMQAKVGNPLRKLVLLKLADNANDQGECWPSYQYIADQCEMSKRSVMAHIDALIESGFLRKELRIGGEKGNKSNLYTLRIPSAGDSLGVVQEIHYPSAGDSLPPSAGAAPRTSHSFESVKEPILSDSANQTSFVDFLFDKFWKHYNCDKNSKVKKKDAAKSFARLMRGKSEEAASMLTSAILTYYQDHLVGVVFGADKLHPTTYLNQQRWEDNPEFMIEFRKQWESESE